MIKKTKVKCDVSSCEHNNLNNCCLDILNISYLKKENNCQKKKETICNNFSLKKD